jgi:G3E family GTPase
MFPIPVSVVTGFLGSGKTTLLNRLLKDPALKDTAVIINEFGDVGIDHLLVEQSSDGIIELSDGCLCCTVRGELVDTLADLIDRLHSGRIKALGRIVIETTGLADPAPVLAAIMGHPALVQALRLDGVITAVDAVNGGATLDNHLEAVKQAAVADRIVLTKTDLEAGGAAADGLTARLRRLNPGAQFLRSGASAAELFNCGLYDPAAKTSDVARWLNEEGFRDREHERRGLEHDDHGHGHHHHDVNRHDMSISAFTLIHDAPVPMLSVQMFLDLLQSTHGERLLRMKGIICLAEDPARPLVIHAVQAIMHPPARLKAWQDDDRRTRLVLITKDLPEKYVRQLFDAFMGKPAIDRADGDALANNPLAIAGMPAAFPKLNKI